LLSLLFDVSSEGAQFLNKENVANLFAAIQSILNVSIYLLRRVFASARVLVHQKGDANEERLADDCS